MVSRSKNYDLDFNEAFEQSYKCASKYFNIEKHKKSEGKGIIKCSTNASLWSWGEIIKITIKKIDNYQSRIIVESLAENQLFDWGKSKENIDLFFYKFERMI